jgi:hypothetical protein
MQVIDNDAVLNAICGGSGSSGNDNQITCTISTKEVGCSGPAGAWMGAIRKGFKELQSLGGDLGCWVYDATH